MIEFIDLIKDLLQYILNGLGSFVKLFTSLPNVFNNLLNVIPEPFKSIILPFLSLIILVIFISVCAKIVSSVKGG